MRRMARFRSREYIGVIAVLPREELATPLANPSFIDSARLSAARGWSPSAFARMPVAIAPGETELTLTLCSPSSIAVQRVRWRTAAFADERRAAPAKHECRAYKPSSHAGL